MDRRLFVRQSALGFTIPFLPVALFKESSSDNQSLNLLANELAELVQRDALGTIQRISVSSIYSPSRTNWSALVSSTRQDFDFLNHILGDKRLSDFSSSLSDAKPDTFGSFSARITHQETSVVWQALARTTNAQGSPVRMITLAGSNGVLQLNLSKSTYKLVDFQGKTVAKKGITKTARLLV